MKVLQTGVFAALAVSISDALAIRSAGWTHVFWNSCKFLKLFQNRNVFSSFHSIFSSFHSLNLNCICLSNFQLPLIRITRTFRGTSKSDLSGWPRVRPALRFAHSNTPCRFYKTIPSCNKTTLSVWIRMEVSLIFSLSIAKCSPKSQLPPRGPSTPKRSSSTFLQIRLKNI